jgi:CRISPR-associated protein Csd1
MILQALKEYYDRRKESDPTIATYGWEWKQIPYLIVLNDEGDVVDLVSTYEVEGKKKEAKSFLLPQGVKRSSGVAANLLWDNLEYVLGVSVETDGSITQTDKNEEKNKAFCAQLNKLDNINDQGVNAVRKFLDKSLEERINSLARFPVWEELKKDKKALITFRLDGYSNTVADSSLVRNAVNSILGDVNAPVRRCLVTNLEAPVARLHQSIKGVWGGNATGTNIVGFNLPPFCSYGKKQGENAPVSEVAVFEYTTALNMLLEKGSANRFQVGEASTVAWGEKNNKLETAIHVIFENSPEDNPDQGVNAVKQLYESVRSGAWTEDEQKDVFTSLVYLLTLQDLQLDFGRFLPLRRQLKAFSYILTTLKLTMVRKKRSIFPFFEF